MRRSNSTWLSVCLILGLGACGDDTPKTEPSATATSTTGEPSSDPAADLARERAAAHMARDERTLAREALRPLVAGEKAAARDLAAAAAIELADDRTEVAVEFLDRASKVAPRDPAVAYLRGQIARHAGDAQAAREQFRLALAGAPDDLPSKLGLAESEDELDDPAAAERLYREIVAVGPSNGGRWYVAAIYRLRNVLTRAGPEREADAGRLDPIIRSLEARGLAAPDATAVLLGELGRLKSPAPRGSVVEPSATPFAFLAGAPIALPAGATSIAALDVDGDFVADLVARGSDATAVLANASGAFGTARLALEGKSTPPLFFDVDNDGDLDLLAITPEGPTLRVRDATGAYAHVEIDRPEMPPGIAGVIACDYDHEGDLDLVLVGAFGVRLWRNDSALDRAKDGTITLKSARFTDATAGSGLPTSGDHEWIRAEDFDGDNDVDFLVRGPDGIVVYDSLRDGKFARKDGVYDLPKSLVGEPMIADFDGDARPDLWFAGKPSTLAPQGRKVAKHVDADARPGSIATADVDLDGALDVLWLDATDGTLRGVLALGNAKERALAVADPAPVGDRLALADFDGDSRVDLAIERNGSVRVLPNTTATGRGARFAWRGLRDNRRAVGATFELRAGPVYRRIYWRGEPEIVGLGSATKIDVLRVTWPNGVTTTRVDTQVADGCAALVEKEPCGVLTQGDGQVGSCPFLYTWNGETYEFISDVLGGAPLGLRMAPDMFVPPDHDEYVLVTGEQLAPKDGQYVMQLTEELREVTYLDHAKLLVVDSPAGTEVYPNELFCFPPFPAHHVHTVRGALAPKKATASDGTDCTAALARVDDVYPQPMEIHPEQFAGLAKPWHLELEFDPAAVRDASKLRLVLTGWFFWSDSSANVAAARSEGVAFVPPAFQVPDGKGGWRDTGPPVGFPAGKTKTMVIDVAPFLDRADPRIRVSTTLRLYWDRIALAVDGDDAPIEVREIALGRAESWRRGFSAPLGSVPVGSADPRNAPERFDWDVLAAEPRWNQHPGLYTRHGDVTELVARVDDRFVILGAGDAATLWFPAKDVAPPKSGMRRDFLLYLDGWAKDRDPNTIQALEVEPLPFHAMSGYPYRADERYPDGPEHARFRREWMTRPAHAWIAPISPAREVEAALGGT